MLRKGCQNVTMFVTGLHSREENHILYTFLTTEGQIDRKKTEQFHKGREEI